MRKIVGPRGEGLNIMKLVNILFTQKPDKIMVIIKINYTLIALHFVMKCNLNNIFLVNLLIF